MIRVMVTILALVLAGGAAAQSEETVARNVGGDVFTAGQTVRHVAEGADDLLMAGETVESAAALGGDAVIAGRKVEVTAPVAGDVYAAGMYVTVTAPVSGDASLLGYRIETGEIGGDLRATGSEVRIAGPVAGYAAITAERVVLEAEVAGEMHVAAREIEFGSNARIGGQLFLYEAEGEEAEVPASVIGADRITRREVEEWEPPMEDFQPVNAGRVLASFIAGIIGLTALATLVAALIPEALAEMRRRLLAAPFGSLWVGFLAQSVIVGGMVVFAMTIIGIFAIPAFVLLAMVAAIAGYVVGVYSFGVGLLMAFGRSEPGSIGEKALSAGVGALIAGIIAAIPFLGWLFVLALSLAGLGAIAEKLFRPRFLGRAY
jgi:hypothetical protein